MKRKSFFVVCLLVFLIFFAFGCSYNRNLSISETLLIKGDCVTAKRYIDKALKSDPRDPRVLKLKNEIELCLKAKEFQAYLAKAHSLNPHDLYSILGEYRKALALNIDSADIKDSIILFEKQIANIQGRLLAIRDNMNSKEFWVALKMYQEVSEYRDYIPEVSDAYTFLESCVPDLVESLREENKSFPIQLTIEQSKDHLAVLNNIFPNNPVVASFDKEIASRYEQECDRLVSKYCNNLDSDWSGLAFLLYREAVKRYPSL